MGHASSPFVQSLDKAVATCSAGLKWAAYSKDHLAISGARALIQNWSTFTRHSRRCWAYVVGNCPHVEVRKFIVTETSTKRRRSKAIRISSCSCGWASPSG